MNEKYPGKAFVLLLEYREKAPDFIITLAMNKNPVKRKAKDSPKVEIFKVLPFLSRHLHILLISSQILQNPLNL